MFIKILVNKKKLIIFFLLMSFISILLIKINFFKIDENENEITCLFKIPLTFSQIHECLIVKEKKYKKMGEFLSELPKEYRSIFSLVHHSRSLQGASYKNPRVIFYGPGIPKLVMSFTGEASSIEGQEIDNEAINKLEMIAWNQENKKFEFYEVQFPGESNNLKYAKLSEKNPQACKRCHGGEDMRPNWQHYNQWPGVYASNDDRPSELELTELNNFFKYANTHPRYRHIENLEKSFEINKHTKKEVADFKMRMPQWRPMTKTLHNSVLLEGLADLNFRRVAHILRELPNYENVRDYFFYALMCTNVKDFNSDIFSLAFSNLKNLPNFEPRQEFRTNYTKPNLLEMIKNTYRNQVYFSQSNACFFEAQKYDRGHIFFYLYLSLLVEHYGYDFDNFFLDFRPSNYYSMNIPGTYYSKLAAKMIEEDNYLNNYFQVRERSFYNVAYTFPNLVATAISDDPKTVTQACEKLRPLAKKSLAYLKKTLVPEADEQCEKLGSRDAPTIHKTCKGCHGGPPVFEEIGKYSQRSLEMIAYYISEKAGEHRMPPNKKFQLSVNEQKEFIQYLKSHR